MNLTFDEHLETFARAGFTVLPSMVSEHLCDSLFADIESDWQRFGSPPLHARPDVEIGPSAHVSQVGFARGEALDFLPEVESVLLEPMLLQFLRAVFSTFELEMCTSVLSDETRPYLEWHQHVGGIDEPNYRRKSYPRFERCERLGCTLYLAPLDEAHGVLRVMARELTAPTEPPFDPKRQDWIGAEHVQAPRGSLLLIDQGTWHAVEPMHASGRRAFVGSFVRRKGVEARRHDAAVTRALARNAILASHYGASP